jgi:predicted nucleic acid-binding protein
LILVDTNVLLDVLRDDPVWGDWSQRQLEAAAVRSALCINAIIYAEVSIAYHTIEDLDRDLAIGGLVLDALPPPALFLAGKVYLKYRRTPGASRNSILPDFFIGAHAAVSRLPLLTRDSRRYRTYFPTVELISPP